jgi:hypothetical protein
MTMWYHLIIAIVGVVALSVGWMGVQALERAVKRMPRGSDVLACWMCEGRGGCHCALRGKSRVDEKAEGTER